MIGPRCPYSDEIERQEDKINNDPKQRHSITVTVHGIKQRRHVEDDPSQAQHESSYRGCP